MGTIVKVWNDNKYPHSEKFKGTQLHILPGGYIEMEFEEAMEFKGQFTAPVRGNDDQPDPRFFKMIRVEIPKNIETRVDPLMCHADGSRAADQDDYAKRLQQYAHLRVEDSAAEKARFESQQRQIDALQAQIAKMAAAQPEKRGPGRPRKDAEAAG